MVGSIVERVFGRIKGKDYSSSSVVPFGVPSASFALQQNNDEEEEAKKTFDYCCTLSDSYDMPINFGIQFVAPGKTQRAAEFLKGVCSIYDFSATFTAGQEVGLSSNSQFFFFAFFFKAPNLQLSFSLFLSLFPKQTFRLSLSSQA